MAQKAWAHFSAFYIFDCLERAVVLWTAFFSHHISDNFLMQPAQKKADDIVFGKVAFSTTFTFTLNSQSWVSQILKISKWILKFIWFIIDLTQKILHQWQFKWMKDFDDVWMKSFEPGELTEAKD